MQMILKNDADEMKKSSASFFRAFLLFPLSGKNNFPGLILFDKYLSLDLFW
jgi:hypothetical protein